jgi:hypothetical protein
MGVTFTKEQLEKAQQRGHKVEQPAVAAKPMTARERLFAKGRLKTGQMNKTESTYAEYLSALERAGEVKWWRFEGIKLKLAENTHLTIDFAVLTAEGYIELHDVKGSAAIVQDDALAKMKIAAELFPFKFFIVYPRRQKDGGGWDIHPVNP